MLVTLGQEYIVEDKSSVILYNYINRHAGTPTKHHGFRSLRIVRPTCSNGGVSLLA